MGVEEETSAQPVVDQTNTEDVDVVYVSPEVEDAMSGGRVEMGKDVSVADEDPKE